MTTEALIAFEQARKEMLEAQRQCGWCDIVFETPDQLIDHINENHI